MTAPTPPGRKVAIAGASSLLGKEIKLVLEESSFPFSDLRLVDEVSYAGRLTAAAGEPVVIAPIDEESFAHARVVFFAGSPEFTVRYQDAALIAGAYVVDLSGALASSREASPWIPGLDDLLSHPCGSNKKLFASPSAPAILACSLAAGLANHHPSRIAMFMLQPVSERGQEGIEELESQTISLLSFQPAAQNVYDAQVAFNILSQFGEKSQVDLAHARRNLVESVARYLDGRLPLPATQLIHAPVFYSTAFSAFVEFSQEPPAGQLEKALHAAGFLVHRQGESAPNNVSVAGESRIHVAAVERDRANPNQFWLFGAMDNLRLAAVNAAGIAERLLAN